MVGNTVVDALLYTRDRVASGYRLIEPALAALPTDKKLMLATTHRRENIGDPIRYVLRALRTLGEDGDKLVSLPVHLNPDVRKQVLDILASAPNVHLLPPLLYPDFVHLLSKTWCVVSDSGGVQEEAPTFALQIVITLDTTERPEVVEAGFGRLAEGAGFGKELTLIRRSQSAHSFDNGSVVWGYRRAHYGSAAGKLN